MGYNETNKPLINPNIPNSTYVMHVVFIWIYKFIRCTCVYVDIYML